MGSLKLYPWSIGVVVLLAGIAHAQSKDGPETDVRAKPAPTPLSLEQRLQELERKVNAFSSEYVTRSEFSAAMAKQAQINQDMTDVNQQLQGEIAALRSEFETASNELKDVVDKLGQISRPSGDGGFVPVTRFSSPIGKVIVVNRMPSAQDIYVDGRLVQLPGYGTSAPIPVNPGTISTSIPGFEGPKNWNIGPSNDYTLVIYINPSW